MRKMQLHSEINDLLTQCPLSSLLPYETYDSESEIFINKRSLGFILEVGSFNRRNRSQRANFR